MESLWSVYHQDIPPFLLQLAAAAPMQRLRQVGMNCGCEYTSFPRFRCLPSYSRYDHSLGVGLIVWHFTGDAAQAAAGLLHDVATPVFAHTVDFLQGDHLHQESTEGPTAALISASKEIRAVLEACGIAVEDVWDYHRYPIADNDPPGLSADRLEYTLGNLVNYGFASPEQAAALYADLTVEENEQGAPELAFSTPERAAEFALASLKTSRVYVADEDRFSMELLSRLLRLALERGTLMAEDLQTTEPEVIARLESDRVCAPLWAAFRACSQICSMPDRPVQGRWLQVPAKLRCIDPLCRGLGRVSAWHSEFARELKRFRALPLDGWLGPFPF